LLAARYAGALMAETTTCAIIGGGPAGVVLGLLLARAGVEVTLLEKHGDFLRDFRGDTVHPTTLRLLDELGLWERFAALPYSEIRNASIESNGRPVTYVDFGRLRLPHPFIAMVPQWDLLNLLAEAAQAEPNFTLRMRTEVTGLLREGGRVTSVRYQGPEGAGELHAELTVACDGRWSIARHEAGLKGREYPVNFDVWWFRLPHKGAAQFTLLPRIGHAKAVIAIPRKGYFQIAYLGPKGTDAELRARGIEAFRRDVGELVPEAADSVDALKSMDDVKHLDVRVNRLHRWHTDGLLCIGDAAHAMSPVGGVGINLAVQDAVAAATLLAEPLRQHRVTGRDLAAVRRRRALPTAVTQTVQRVLHRQLLGRILRGEDPTQSAALLGLVGRLPWLSVVPAYFIGVGMRPEHAPAFARRGSVGSG
jgi:2-polyprenyl-6-methoxyphenol hydroxylase-like FAD-dependent oxidoreductase